MKTKSIVLQSQGPVHVSNEVLIECTDEEKKQLRDALAVMAMVEKVIGIRRKHADWTMVHSYRFTADGVYVIVEQGACGL